MAKKKITELVSELVDDFLAENGLSLYNTEFVKEGKDWFLRVYIDKDAAGEGEEAYVSTDDCEKVSRFLSDKLDETDPIEQNYYLEISSPGLDRALLKESDYVKFAGRPVDVSLYKAFEGHKNFTEAKLIGLEENLLVIEAETADKGAKNKKVVTYKIPFEQVSKVKLSVVF